MNEIISCLALYADNALWLYFRKDMELDILPIILLMGGKDVLFESSMILHQVIEEEGKGFNLTKSLAVIGFGLRC